MDRRAFLGVTAAGALAAAQTNIDAKIKTVQSTLDKADPGIHIRFLGTGAAGGLGQDRKGRRKSSVLVEGKFLIDLTEEALDMIPDGCHPDTIFYTHSHGDHFSPAAALSIGIKHVYVSNTWHDVARAAFKSAIAEHGGEMPVFIPICIDSPVECCGVTVTAMPADHATDNLMEQSVIYLLEKDGARIIYATDTACLMGTATRIAGIDKHLPKINPISGLIMEATMGVGHEDDFRLFNHSSVASVARTTKVLLETGALKAPASQKPVYITHMARSLYKEGDVLPEVITAAYDGLEVVFPPKE